MSPAQGGPGVSCEDAINAKYALLGGASGSLGIQVTAVQETQDRHGAKGCFCHYENGSIFKSDAGEAHALHGPIRQKYSEADWAAGFLGFPTTDVVCNVSGPAARCYALFANGGIYWTSTIPTGPHLVHSAIYLKYKQAQGVLGYPITDEGPTATHGSYAEFEKGAIYWSSDSGAHEMHGIIWKKYQALGRDEGLLGYPITDQKTTADGTGQFNDFHNYRTGQSGAIYFAHETGHVRAVYGGIFDLWNELGREAGLGYPTTDEEDTPLAYGKVSRFSKRAAIYYDNHRGAYEVYKRPLYPPPKPAEQGRWEIPEYTSGVVGMHAALLHTNEILFFAYDEPIDPSFTGEVPPYNGGSAVLDLTTHEIHTPTYTGSGTETVMPNIFCSGHAFLPDGRLLVVGGDRENVSRMRSVHLYTPGEGGGAWTTLSPTSKGRWYCSCATLASGDVLIVGGDEFVSNVPNANKKFEVFDGATASIVKTIEQPSIGEFGKWATYPFVFVVPPGRLVVHGGARTLFYSLPDLQFETGIDLPTIGAATERTYPREATCVLLPLLPGSDFRAKILMIGGGSTPQEKIREIRTDATASCLLLDTGAPTLEWVEAASMANPRVMPDAVLLPDGSVLVMNGSSRGAADNAANPVWEAELYDPAANTWTTMAPMEVPRLYHATALLLPDGRVMTAGTDSVFNPDPFHEAETRVEIFSPPYLFKGERPRLDSVPETLVYGQEFTISTSDGADVDAVVLMRCGSVTHSFNSDQRHVGLPIRRRQAGSVTALLPLKTRVTPPGRYMLFLLRDGVPSAGRFVHVPPRTEASSPDD